MASCSRWREDVEEGGDGDGVVAGLVGDVEGDGDALGGRLVVAVAVAVHWSLTSVTAARAALSSTMAAPAA